MSKAIPSAEALLVFGFHCLILAALLAVALTCYRHRPPARHLVNLFAVVAVCMIAIFFHPALLIVAKPGWNWNWDGKLLGILATFALVPLLGIRYREIGVARPLPGSMMAALAGTGTICLLSWSYYFLIGDSTDLPTAETLWYQATIPGLQEEPFFRALLPILLDRVLPQRSLRIAGADLSGGALLGVLWFGILHGVGIVDGAITGNVQAVVTTGMTGLGLAWLYARTGSLLVPILAHNIVNMGLVSLPFARVALG